MNNDVCLVIQSRYIHSSFRFVILFYFCLVCSDTITRATDSFTIIFILCTLGLLGTFEFWSRFFFLYKSNKKYERDCFIGCVLIRALQFFFLVDINYGIRKIHDLSGILFQFSFSLFFFYCFQNCNIAGHNVMAMK